MAALTQVATRRRRWLAFVCLLTALAGITVVARPAPAVLPSTSVIGTITISGIPGGRDGRTAAIPVSSYSWSLRSSVTFASGGGASVGKATVSDLVVTKALDGAGPRLMTALATGTVRPSVTLRVFDPGTTRVAVEYLLSNVFVTYSGHSQASASATSQLERVSFTYAKVRQTWFSLNADVAGTPIVACFDQSANSTAC